MRVYGEDPATLRAQAARMQRMLAQVDGVVDPRVEAQIEEPTVAIEVDLAKAQRLGSSRATCAGRRPTLLSGIEVGSLFRQQKVFEVVVRATPEARHSVTDIRRLLIDTPGGGHVRLGDVATVRVRPTPAVIQREASSRRIDVTADVRGRGLQAVKGEVDRPHPAARLPARVPRAGDRRLERRQATAARVLGAAAWRPPSAIFLLLQAAFGSWRLASLAFLTLPIALLGGEIAGLIDGATFSLGAIAGLLAVFGIAVAQRDRADRAPPAPGGARGRVRAHRARRARRVRPARRRS